MGDSKLHALLSPSGASRWMACTPSARLEENMPDTAGDAAREGTLAHAIAEIMLQREVGLLTNYDYQAAYFDLIRDDQMNGRRIYKEQNPDATEDEVIANAEGEFYCNAMHEYCEQYVTFVIEKWAESKAHTPGAALYVEQRLDISDWAKDSFGTGDTAIVANTVLKCIDLKYGKGVEVSAINNTQMKVYALGWLKECGLEYNIERVEMTIFQPRMDNYSTWEISVTDLLDWAETELRPKAILAYNGEGEFVPGSHCGFCKVKTTCKALADYNLELAKYEFDDAVFLTDDDIADILSRAGIFINWINAVMEYALSEAVKRGKKWPGYKLVEGRSNRYLTDEKKVIKVLESLGYEEGEYFDISLKGITKLEKLLGGPKTFNKLLNHLIKKPSGKPTLVPVTDDRAEFSAATHAISDFDDPEENLDDLEN